MGVINLLEPQVANLIAAGEVVERPASAIKELMENAIDAGASRITAEIKNGGVTLMRITDDGCGMTKEDAVLCVRRHATSKIKKAADLDGIVTLGFRGEAMAAIASVSRLRILTRTADSETGTAVTCEAGTVVSVEEAGCPFGTTVLVEELFHNVPARRKFLKRDASETAAVAAVLEKIALSHPEIAIKFIADGVLKFQTAGDGALISVIYAVLGRDFAKKTIPLRDMTEGIEVEGVIGTPENHRGNRNYENFFINGRYVKCGTASAALEQAFTSYIPSDKFPCCVLSLTIHPAFVDVNVHPQKLEVKFSSDKAVFNAVYCAVRNALMTKVVRPTPEEEPTRLTGDSFKLYQDILSMKAPNEEEARRVADDRDSLVRKYEQLSIPGEVREADVSVPASGGYASQPGEAERPAFTRPASVPPAGTVRPTVPDEAPRQPSPEVRPEPNASTPIPEVRPEPDVPDPGPETRSEPDAAASEPDAADAANPGEPTVPWFRVTGVAFQCYVFVEMADRMIVIDKHAAHERILFEKLRKNLKSLKPPASQLLLLPHKISLTPEETEAAEAYQTELAAVGFAFSPCDEPGMTALLQIPSGLSESEAEAMFRELAARLAEGTGDVSLGREAFYERALYQASCKAAVKGGRDDTAPEALNWIVTQVLTDPHIRYCPHGRPVAFEMTKDQFERRFERK